jgi:hypothetical protein
MRKNRNRKRNTRFITKTQGGEAATKFGNISRKACRERRRRMQRPQSSEIRSQNDLRMFLTFPHNLSASAPWREKYPIPIALRLQISCAGRENLEAQ